MSLPPLKTRKTALRGRLVSFDAEPSTSSKAVRFIEDGLLVFEDGIITEIGEAAEILKRLPVDVAVTDHRPYLIMPGFVDPHLHMPQTQVIGSYGTELLDWLANYTFPEESRYHDPDLCAAASLFLVEELLRCGTTTAAVYCTSHPASVDALFGEALRRGMRLIAGKVMMDRNAPEALLDTAERGYEESKALIARWHGQGRLSYAITPRFAPTSTEAQLRTAGALAVEYPDMHIQTHLSENHGEIAFVRELFPWSKDYTEVYERYGLVRDRALFGHCIHLTERERTALADAGASAIFCPTSNLFLGSGLFDLAAMKTAGIKVGLATDIGGGTSYSLLTTAMEAYKVLALQRQTLPAFEAFHMLTAGNAAAIGMEDRIGRLAPGYEADVVVLDGHATMALQQRMERVTSLAEELFVLMTMGDDRVVAATYVAGKRVHDRQAFTHRPMEDRPEFPLRAAELPAESLAATDDQ